MPRAPHGPAAPRVKSSPRSSQTAYPTPPSRRASRVAYPAPQPAYPIPPSHGPPAAPPESPTLHPNKPAILPHLPRTRRLPPKSPTLHPRPSADLPPLPASLPYTLGLRERQGQRPPSQPTYPTPAGCQTPDTTRSSDHAVSSLPASRPAYPTPRPGHGKTTKSRSHNNHTPESSL